MTLLEFGELHPEYTFNLDYYWTYEVRGDYYYESADGTLLPVPDQYDEYDEEYSFHGDVSGLRKHFKDYNFWGDMELDEVIVDEEKKVVWCDHHNDTDIYHQLDHDEYDYETKRYIIYWESPHPWDADDEARLAKIKAAKE